MKLIHGFSATVVLVAWLYASAAFAAAPVSQNGIESLVFGKSAGNLVMRLEMRQALTEPPSHFSIANPARLVFDFPDTDNNLGFTSKAVNEDGLRSVNVVQSNDRSRLVLNLEKLTRFETKLEGKALLITLGGVDSLATRAASHQFEAAAPAQSKVIRDIRFRRDEDGTGRVIVELTSSDTGVDIQQKGTKLQVVFNRTSLPENLRRQMDVVDFATPVTTITTAAAGDDVVMDIVPRGLWEHIAFQSDNQFIIDVKPVKEDPNKLLQGSKASYQGELISLDFHSVPVYELLRVFADITNFNIIASDSVAAMGKVTLRMRDVPWDQALDMVLEMKNLAKRRNGSVIWIAPRDEMRAMEKQELEARQQIGELEPTLTESFEINYQKAADVQKLLGNKDQPVLSKSGSVVVDEYSNRLFVTDVPSRLNKVRDLIKLIDQPAKQVLIEARIVEARDNFGKELGFKINLSNTKPIQVGQSNIFLNGGGASVGAAPTTGSLATTSFTQASTFGKLTFSLYNASLTRVLGLELDAMETDGKGKSLSNPRVVTGNNIKALIEQGDEIPVVTPGSGTTPATVTYKKAKLSLETTPQITPDGRIKMKLVIAKDRPDFSRKVQENPTIVTSKVETEVMVDNGGTLVIGGVTGEESTSSEDRIPVLGDIPYVGFLFKHRSVVQERKELLVFITPKVIDERLSVR